eukprot:1161129-Pelagomonas_calceolata.AAC.11
MRCTCASATVMCSDAASSLVVSHCASAMHRRLSAASSWDKRKEKRKKRLRKAGPAACIRARLSD